MFPAELIDVRLVSGCEAMLSPATDCCLAASSASSRLESAMAACGSCPTCAALPRLYGVAQKDYKGTERLQLQDVTTADADGDSFSTCKPMSSAPLRRAVWYRVTTRVGKQHV